MRFQLACGRDRERGQLRRGGERRGGHHRRGRYDRVGRYDRRRRDDGGAAATGAAGTSGGTTVSGAGGAGRAARRAPAAPAAGSGRQPQCSDGIDNDGDGKIDYDDPECVGPLDNDESSFATGIPGDNMDACKQDCFFDGNSGVGDDGCEWQLKCDPMSVENKCPYDMQYATQHTTECSVSASQSPKQAGLLLRRQLGHGRRPLRVAAQVRSAERRARSAPTTSSTRRSTRASARRRRRRRRPASTAAASWCRTAATASAAAWFRARRRRSGWRRPARPPTSATRPSARPARR